MKSPKIVYMCSECGYQTSKWLGRCPSCQAWNTFEEETVQEEAKTTKVSGKHPEPTYENKIIAFDDLAIPEYMRSFTGLGEFDRVLGGGLVVGSVVLLSGEPGIGKSTLLMQICNALGKERKVLYVSGEESQGQLKLRAKRLNVSGTNLFLLTETNLDRIIAQMEQLHPEILIIDSIQTIYNDQVASAPGSVTQVKETAMRFINKAKNEGFSILLVGHVNKEGGIAGPKVLEHMVDAVIYFEGERQQSYRIIRAIKNRYGSTNEIGVFEMTDVGLEEVANPSEMLLSGRPKNVSGNCAVCIMEGSRPIIAEIQALITPTVFPAPRRTSNGIDYNRMCLLLAVLEKRLGLRFSSNDAYLNVVGGLKLDEPASDLAVALALISSIKDKPLEDSMIAIGELGLAGECRAVSHLEQRVKEAARLGFTKILLPKRNWEMKTLQVPNVDVIPIRSIFETLGLFN